MPDKIVLQIIGVQLKGRLGSFTLVICRKGFTVFYTICLVGKKSERKEDRGDFAGGCLFGAKKKKASRPSMLCTRMPC